MIMLHAMISEQEAATVTTAFSSDSDQCEMSGTSAIRTFMMRGWLFVFKNSNLQSRRELWFISLTGSISVLLSLKVFGGTPFDGVDGALAYLGKAIDQSGQPEPTNGGILRARGV